MLMCAVEIGMSLLSSSRPLCKSLSMSSEYVMNESSLIFGSGWILFDIWKQDSWQNENYAQILRVDSPGYLHKYWAHLDIWLRLDSLWYLIIRWLTNWKSAQILKVDSPWYLRKYWVHLDIWLYWKSCIELILIFGSGGFSLILNSAQHPRLHHSYPPT